TAAAAKQVQVRGTANGTARLQFPGLNHQAATGRIDASFDAAVSPPESSTEPPPGKGEIALVATGRGFNIERAFIRSTNSELTVTGEVGWKGAANLDVKFNSQDMAEVQRVVEAFGLVTDEMRTQYPVALSGPGQFTGRLEGTLDSPNVSGHVKLDSIQSAGDTVSDVPAQEVGSFEGDIDYSPTLLRIDNAALVRPDGSRADFSVTARLDAEAVKDKNGIAVKANVQSFDLPSLVRVAQPTLANLIGRGTITGTIDLKGLPGPRSIEGTANGQGKWGNTEDWSELNLNALIQGQNVMFNGRDLGNAKVTAVTENGLLKVEATANVLDQPRSLAATIDLRDRDAYPVSANIEFTDTDIGPYLGLVAPELAGVSGTATGTIKVSGPLRDPDKIQAVA